MRESLLLKFTMKKHFLSIFLFFSCLAVFGQVRDAAFSHMLRQLLLHDVPEVNVSKVKNNADSLLFLDCRALREYKISHLPRAIWVGFDDFDSTRLAFIDKNVHIVTYCSVGYRSEKIAEKMYKMGYNNVQNLVGGIFEWVNSGFVVVDNNEKITQNIHAFDRAWGIWLRKGQPIYD